MTESAFIVYLWAMGGLIIGAIFRRDMAAGWPLTLVVMFTWWAALPAGLIVGAFAHARKK
jgi:hypothetical protein